VYELSNDTRITPLTPFSLTICGYKYREIAKIGFSTLKQFNSAVKFLGSTTSCGLVAHVHVLKISVKNLEMDAYLRILQ